MSSFIKKFLNVGGGNTSLQNLISPQYLGVYCAEGTPVPIPNTEVKLRSVDGTSWFHVEE